MDVRPYHDKVHRDQVVALWTQVFAYAEARNEPGLVIDRKVAAGDGLFLVAVEDGLVTGTVIAGYDGHRGWIYSMAVRPECRRRGVGTALLERAEGRLRELGCVKVNLQVHSGNAGAVGFYRRAGYRVEERVSMGKELPENVG